MGVSSRKMGCGSGKDDKPSGKDDQPTLTPEEIEAARKKQIRLDAREQLCTKIVNKLDKDGNGKMSAEEVQMLVKNMYPCYRTTPAETLDLNTNEHIRELNGMTKEQLVQHLMKTMDEGWTRAFAMLLGVLGNPDKAINEKKAELKA